MENKDCCGAYFLISFKGKVTWKESESCNIIQLLTTHSNERFSKTGSFLLQLETIFLSFGRVHVRVYYCHCEIYNYVKEGGTRKNMNVNYVEEILLGYV